MKLSEEDEIREIVNDEITNFVISAIFKLFVVVCICFLGIVIGTVFL
jgi:hypothetical protein